ncbi:MAG: zinc-binding dehydrogenase [Deltaproteobacteria bacterium]|nr:zinc-binding dehydrogenase [Deltaproteobacteria bacterium]
MSSVPTTSLQLFSNLRKDGTLELSLAESPVPAPKADEVVVRVEATPINPSDLGMLLAGADMSGAKYAGTPARPVVTAQVGHEMLRAMAARLGHPMPVGNEGAGIVIAAGSAPEAQALLGKTVALIGGAMYAQVRVAKAALCLVMPPGTSARDGASCFVNPLTALGMVETMRLEGHKALVHTAAASNLGQMLVKLCLADGVALVNVVRKPEQEQLLRGLGAKYVCNTSAPSFRDDLTNALAETGATIAFDAIGGGKQGSVILSCMEVAALRTAKEFNRYGSTVHKQLYIYGGLDRGPTELVRSFGMAWSVGGWLLMPFLQRVGPAAAQALRERVAREVKTTFASHYTKEVSLAEALTREAIGVYAKQATGEKVLITPQKA